MVEAAYEQGERRKAKETARKMLVKGYTQVEICELTGLSIEEVAMLTKKDNF